MPWKERSVMDERLQFVARRLAGETMSELCREFGISRKTGYKIFDRYQKCGVQGLTDRSRRPYRYAHRKIRERLNRRFIEIKIPVKSTIISSCRSLSRCSRSIRRGCRGQLPKVAYLLRSASYAYYFLGFAGSGLTGSTEHGKASVKAATIREPAEY
jgi:transposase-like protein